MQLQGASAELHHFVSMQRQHTLVMVIGGTWSSGNTAIATVNPSTGFVTVVAPGTVNIIYTVGTTGCNSPVLNFKTLTVFRNANAGTVSSPSPVLYRVWYILFQAMEIRRNLSSSKYGCSYRESVNWFYSNAGCTGNSKYYLYDQYRI